MGSTSDRFEAGHGAKRRGPRRGRGEPGLRVPRHRIGHGRILPTSIALLACGVALRCQPAPAPSEGSGVAPLSGLSAPDAVLRRIAVATAESGDPSHGLEILARLGRPPGHESAIVFDDALERVLVAAIEAEDAELARRGLDALSPEFARGFRGRALALRVDDLTAVTAAERLHVDRRVEQLQHDRTREAGTHDLGVCEHLEALYQRRLSLAEPAAHRVDALLKQWGACRSEATYRQVTDRLVGLARQADEAGLSDDAVTYWQVVVEIGSRGPGLGADLLTEARARIDALLEPTRRRNRRDRFERHFATHWADEGIYDASTETVTVEVPVPVPEECAAASVESCPALLQAALQLARERLAERAVEAAELPQGARDPVPGLDPIDVRLVRREGQTAYFAASVTLDVLFRSADRAAD